MLFRSIALQYQGNIESIPEINATEGLEYQIDKLIRLLTQKKTKIAFAASEGELSPQGGPQGQGGGLTGVAHNLEFYETVPVQLNQGAKPIPDDAVALTGLAGVLIAQQQPAKALPLLERAVQSDPTSATAHFRLSTLYRNAGRTADAKRELNEYLKYKKMHANLSVIFKQMRLPTTKDTTESSDAAK